MELMGGDFWNFILLSQNLNCSTLSGEVSLSTKFKDTYVICLIGKFKILVPSGRMEGRDWNKRVKE